MSYFFFPCPSPTLSRQESQMQERHVVSLSRCKIRWYEDTVGILAGRLHNVDAVKLEPKQ